MSAPGKTRHCRSPKATVCRHPSGSRRRRRAAAWRLPSGNARGPDQVRLYRVDRTVWIDRGGQAGANDLALPRQPRGDARRHVDSDRRAAI